MTKTYRIALPLLGAWLAGWMYLSWAAIQDDALIHLRYADNLFLYHFITYDGVHGDYGASSLLYVALLAVLRGLTASPSACSGDMKAGVPSTQPRSSSRSDVETSRASPKSSSFTQKRSVLPSRMMLSGLTSRCTSLW